MLRQFVNVGVPIAGVPVSKLTLVIDCKAHVVAAADSWLQTRQGHILALAAGKVGLGPATGGKGATLLV